MTTIGYIVYEELDDTPYTPQPRIYPFATYEKALEKFNELLGDIPNDLIEYDDKYPHVVINDDADIEHENTRFGIIPLIEGYDFYIFNI